MRDPRAELFDASLGIADDTDPASVDPALRASLHLVRRRFGLALPPPFVERPSDAATVPIRAAGPVDGPAIAAVQRRAFRAGYRGLLSDRFLNTLDFSYLGAYWTGRTAVSPSPRHRLLVAGRPGEVHAAADSGPSRDADVDVDDEGVILTGEVRTFYVDPSVARRGLGSRLLSAAVEALTLSGFVRATLWVVETNAPARAFYEAHGWTVEAGNGVARDSRVDDEVLHEIRYRRPPGVLSA